MQNLLHPQKELKNKGFVMLENIYTDQEVEEILVQIEGVEINKETFRKSADLFAIRQFFKEVPTVIALVFNQNLRSLIRQFLGEDFFLVKSIYFDKPETSNWYVAYHQDLTISVDKKLNLEGFDFWTVKQNQFAVQPPLDILENIITMRIHLDDTDEANGALRVIPGSHLKKIYRPESIDWTIETEEVCCVKKGGVMLMKPLLLHSSKRTTNRQRRRVIHLEFSNQKLPDALNWAEKMDFYQT